MWFVVVVIYVGTPQTLTTKNAYNNHWHSFKIATKPKKRKKRDSLHDRRREKCFGCWLVVCVHFVAFFSQWFANAIAAAIAALCAYE